MGIREQSSTGAARCDICDKPCDATTLVGLSPDQLRQVADLGFDPFEECEAPLNSPGKSREAHLRAWKKAVSSRRATWAVCPVCHLRMNDYLNPAPAATPQKRQPTQPSERPAPPIPRRSSRRPVKQNEPEPIDHDYEEPTDTPPRRASKPSEKLPEPSASDPRRGPRPEKVSDPGSFDYEEPTAGDRRRSRRGPDRPDKVSQPESFDYEEQVVQTEDGPGWRLNRGVIGGILGAGALVALVMAAVLMRSNEPKERSAPKPAVAASEGPEVSAWPVKLKAGETGGTTVTAARDKWLGDIALEGGSADGVTLAGGTIRAGESTAKLTVRVANDARAGPHTILLNASVEGASVSVPVTVTVEGKPLQVAVKPGAFSINAGETRSLSVTVWGQQQGVVTVALDLPKGVRNRGAPLQGVMANGSCTVRVELEADLDADAVPPRDVRVSATSPRDPPVPGALPSGVVPGGAVPGGVAKTAAAPTDSASAANSGSTTFKFSLVRNTFLDWPTRPMTRTLIEGDKLLLPIELKREVAKGPIQLEVKEGELPKGVKPSWARKTLSTGDSRATLELTAGDGVEDARKVVNLVATVEGKPFEFPIELITYKVVLFNKPGHPGGATRVLFTPRPTRVISGGVDGTVLVREVDGGGRKLELKGHDDAISCLALSPSRSQLVSGGEKGGVCLWNLATGTLTRKLLGGKTTVLRLSLTDETAPGETVQAGAAPAQVLVWLTKKGANLSRSYPAPTDEYAAELRGGHTPGRPGSMEYLMFQSSKEIELRQLGMRGSDDKKFIGHTSEVMMARFSPDYSRVVSAGSDGTVRLWDVATTKELRTFRGHKGSVLDAVFSPDGRRIASAGADGTVRVWRIPPPPIDR